MYLHTVYMLCNLTHRILRAQNQENCTQRAYPFIVSIRVYFTDLLHR